MLVKNLSLERRSETIRVSAKITWEESDRPELDLYFETDAGPADDISPEPDAFLTAVALPAMRRGERRISIEGTVCPRLRDGLRTAMAILESWNGPPRSVLEIEATKGFRPTRARDPARAAACMGGGVDGFHMLRRNLREFPRDHPFAFQELYTVIGLLTPEAGRSAERDSPFVRTRKALARVAAEVGLPLTVVSTNLLRLEADLAFFRDEWCSAAILSASHAFPGRWSMISIASAGRPGDLPYPTGTHPLLDPAYSSSSLEIRHEGSRFGRLERMRELAGWQTAMENLVVCMNVPPPPYLNCGTCEKCLRTMAEIEAVGGLAHAREFPAGTLQPEAISKVAMSDFSIYYWKEIPEALRTRGREDLALAIERRLREVGRARRSWKPRLARFDSQFLGGSLRGLRRRIRGS